MPGTPLRAWVAAVLAAGALPACTAVAEDGAPAPVQVGPTVEASAEPSPPEEPPPAAPFDLEVLRITVVGMENAAILGVSGAPSSPDAAEQAVRAARDVLAAFLNGQLVAEATWFSREPIDLVLTAHARAALSDDDRAGLGEVKLPVVRTGTGPASAVAQVLIDGDQAHAVTLSYNALFTVELEDGSISAAKQSGAMTFVPTDEGWRADAAEVTTDLPEGTP